MSAIPAVMVPSVRAALYAQGLPPELVTNEGTINPSGLLASIYDTVEFRSAASPTVKVSTRSLVDANAPSNPLVQWLSPSVAFTAADGQVVEIAPYGRKEGGWLPLLLGVTALVGAGFVLGRLTR